MGIALQTGIRFISGQVVKGKQLGRTIGFPTANLDKLSGLSPKQGVYGVHVYRGNQQYNGVMNVGFRPTFQDGEHKTIEVHLLNFNEDIYDETLVMEILFRIRDERKFSNIEELKIQLQNDVNFSEKAFVEIQKFNMAI